MSERSSLLGATAFLLNWLAVVLVVVSTAPFLAMSGVHTGRGMLMAVVDAQSSVTVGTISTGTTTLFNHSHTLDRLFVRCLGNLSDATVRSGFVNALNTILVQEKPSAVYLTDLFQFRLITWRSNEWAMLDFRSRLGKTTNDQRIGLAQRIRAGDDTLSFYRVVELYWLYRGDILPPETFVPVSPTQSPMKHETDSSASKVLLILGGFILALLISVGTIVFFVRRRLYIDGGHPSLQRTAVMQHQQQQPDGSVLQQDPSSVPGPPGVPPAMPYPPPQQGGYPPQQPHLEPQHPGSQLAPQQPPPQPEAGGDGGFTITTQGGGGAQQDIAAAL